MAILTEGYFPSIRAALDLELTEDDLPDEVIALPIFLGQAEDQVLALLPDAASTTGSDRRHVMNALVYYTAAMIAPSMPDIISETFGTYIYKRSPVDWNKKAIFLQSLGDEALNVILGLPPLSLRPTTFDVGHACRGR